MCQRQWRCCPAADVDSSLIRFFNSSSCHCYTTRQHERRSLVGTCLCRVGRGGVVVLSMGRTWFSLAAVSKIGQFRLLHVALVHSPVNISVRLTRVCIIGSSISLSNN